MEEIELPHQAKTSDAKPRCFATADPRLEMSLRTFEAALIDEGFKPHVASYKKVPGYEQYNAGTFLVRDGVEVGSRQRR